MNEGSAPLPWTTIQENWPTFMAMGAVGVYIVRQEGLVRANAKAIANLAETTAKAIAAEATARQAEIHRLEVQRHEDMERQSNQRKEQNDMLREMRDDIRALRMQWGPKEPRAGGTG